MKLGQADRGDHPRVRHRRRRDQPNGQRDGWRFDLGGHRFFTKVRAVDELWDEILAPETMLERPRQSRILYRGKLLRVPAGSDERAAQPRSDRGGALRRFVRVGARAPARRTRTTSRVSTPSRFGWRLYRHFFKTYTEKVWGVPVTELSADWGAQRVKDLSLFRAVCRGVEAEAVASFARRVARGHEPHRGVQVPEVRARG